MLKAGIFLDIENLTRCGGYGMRFRGVKELVEAQGTVVLRANAYMAIDEDKEKNDFEYRKKKADYRDSFRSEGFHLVLKKVMRYYDPDAKETVMKANADLDLAVDALLQSENLDYILLGSGDGDFLRLVRALQNRGKRVDLLSFDNTSKSLKEEVDHHFNGFLFPNLLLQKRRKAGRERGLLYYVNEEKGWGFVSQQVGLKIDEVREKIFLHISDLRDQYGRQPTNEEFKQMEHNERIVEFSLEESLDEESGETKYKAVEANLFDWQKSDS